MPTLENTADTAPMNHTTVMPNTTINRTMVSLAFIAGLLSLVWIGSGLIAHSIAMVITAAIAIAYLMGALELRRFRAMTGALTHALGQVPQPLTQLGDWLDQLPSTFQYVIRQRLQGERAALPGLSLTPYLIGLLVMLGMLGTFLGMVVTFQGAVFALEGSADLAAIRSALATPIKGLGLAFGTSVMGVASSAALGLMAAISRRERVLIVRQLDVLIANTLHPFSVAHQREQAFEAIQQQTQGLPKVIDHIQTLIESIHQQHQQLHQQLVQQQDQFHQKTSTAYTDLSTSVAQSLTSSLTSCTQTVTQSLQPQITAALHALTTESQRQQMQLHESVQAHFHRIHEQFHATTSTVAGTWEQALQTQTHSNEQLIKGITHTLAQTQDRIQQHSHALLGEINTAITQSITARTSAEQQQLDAWTQSLDTVASTLQTQWHQASQDHAAQQKAACETLQATAHTIQEHIGHQTQHTAEHITRLLNASDTLLAQRTQAEQAWAAQHSTHIQQITQMWRSELADLRTQENERGQAATQRMEQWQNQLHEHLQTQRDTDHTHAQAAVARLAELQTALTQHLSTLGTALEAPLTRLLETSAQAPQAAAQVISQLHREMSALTARDMQRDTQAAQERTVWTEKMDALMLNLHETTAAQRAAMNQLTSDTHNTIEHISHAWNHTFATQTQHTTDIATQVTSSASELAKLAAAFEHGVQLFTTSNQTLTNHLQQLATALENTTQRSDEQLAYYVAQAREIVDLSISAQQSIVQDLHTLRKIPLETAPR